jgi:hypothetical protein
VKTIALFVLALIVNFIAPNISFAADKDKQKLAAERRADVMPFDLRATTHVVTKTTMGGIQQVVVKNASNATQIALMHEHLKNITVQFSKGNFSDPTQIQC